MRHLAHNCNNCKQMKDFVPPRVTMNITHQTSVYKNKTKMVDDSLFQTLHLKMTKFLGKLNYIL